MAIPSHVLSGRAGLEEVSRRQAASVYYGDHRLLCRLLGDFLAFVDTRDLMLGPRLVLDGFWEAWVTVAAHNQHISAMEADGYERLGR